MRALLFIFFASVALAGERDVPEPTAIAAADRAPTSQPAVVNRRKAIARPPAGQVLELTIKELGNFEYDQDKGGNIPADIVALNGTRLRLSGFMIPMDQADHVREFTLVPSLFSCCYGQPPQIQHTVVCHCRATSGVAYFTGEISVEGRLTVNEKKDDGFVTSIFELDITSVTSR